MPAAGKLTKNPHESAGSCLQMDFGDESSTTDRFREMRQAYRQEPGQMYTHYASARDSPPPDIRHGIINVSNGSTKELIAPTTTQSAFAERQREMQTACYKSERQSRLGKTPITHNPSPLDATFRYGYPTPASGTTVKDLLHANDTEDTGDMAVHGRYVKSHHSYAPGEQKMRGYDWLSNGINPTSFRFGYVPKERGSDSVSTLLKMEPKQHVVRKELEDYRDLHHDHLGAPKNFGFGGGARPRDHTYGHPPKPTDTQWFGGDPEDLNPDHLLQNRARKVMPEPTQDRIFGVPTVRHDIRRPRNKRVTDCQDYGDSKTSAQLVNPSPFVEFGLDEDDFEQPVTRAEMEQLAKDARMGLSAADFDRAWAQASTMGLSNAVSVEKFRRALDILDL
uniref:EFHB C-terminal EF-hand domain-containing protein n=1 Tax=Eutreptiella gymnastica TaxID=73025 RepID=A0A7S4C889_9EUGL